MIYPNLNHLKYFSDAVDFGSISISAEKNLVSHPAVSRAIKAIENQLDVKLLIHRKKSFEVTPMGKVVAQKAKKLLTAATVFCSDNLLPAAPISGTVTIAVSRTLGQAFLTPILKELAEKFPQIKINLRFGTTGEIAEKVGHDNVELGITIGHQKMATLKQTLLRSGQFILIRANTSSGAKAKYFLEENFILTEPKIETELLKKQFYRKYKRQLVVQHEVGSWDMITQLVANGLGVGLVPDISLQTDKKQSVIEIKLPWLNCPYEVYLNQSKTAINSLAARTVAEVIETKIRKLSN